MNVQGPLVSRSGLDPGTLGLKGSSRVLRCVGHVAHVVCFQGNAMSCVGLVSWRCRNMRPVRSTAQIATCCVTMAQEQGWIVSGPRRGPSEFKARCRDLDPHAPRMRHRIRISRSVVNALALECQGAREGPRGLCHDWRRSLPR